MTLIESIEVKSGFVYLLENLLLGGYKIGLTTNPTSRFKALAVGTKTRLVGYWKHDAYRELEKLFHKKFGEKRCPQSEWFALSEDEIAEFIGDISSLAITEFIEPDRVDQLTTTGPRYYFKEAPQFEPNKYANWYYFGVIIVAAAVGYLIGSLQ